MDLDLEDVASGRPGVGSTGSTSFSRIRRPTSTGYRSSVIGGNTGSSLEEVFDASINFGDEISFSEGGGGGGGGGIGGAGGGSAHQKSLVDIFFEEDPSYADHRRSHAGEIDDAKNNRKMSRGKKIAFYFCILIIIGVVFVSVPKGGMFGGGGGGGDSESNSADSVDSSSPEKETDAPFSPPEVSNNNNEKEEQQQGEEEASSTNEEEEEELVQGEVEVSEPEEEEELVEGETTVTISEEEKEEEDELLQGEVTLSEPEIAEIEQQEDRLQAMKEYVLGLGVTTQSELNSFNGPASQAIKWMANFDKAKMDIPGYALNVHNDPNVDDKEMGRQLLQRYGLAVFYFSMQQTYIQSRKRRKLHINGKPTSTEFARDSKFDSQWLKAGSVCDWFGVTCNEFTHVSALNLTASLLDGALVPELFQEKVFPALKIVDLSHNLLHGFFPIQPIENNKLETLHLRENKFEKRLDPLLEQLKALKYLDVTNNLFTGELPDDWSSFSNNLETIRLSENNLHGTLPHNLGSLSKLTLLHLDGNAFIGSIPSGWGSLTSLRTLKISHNLIREKIPAFLGNLPLKHLSLEDNRMTGEVPTSLGKLTDLTSIHLQYNELVGSMPNEVCALTGNDKALQAVTSDCNKPEFQCSCCTSCFR